MSKKEFSFNLAEKMAQAKKELNTSEPLEVSIQADVQKEKEVLAQKKQSSTHHAKQKSTQEALPEPKLFVSGRLNRKDCNYIARSLHISEELLNDINTHCKGSESAIYNYLLSEGLKKIKDASGMIHVDIKDMEGEGSGS